MITPRLEMILRHCNENSYADIGTDHGYIPIKLWERGARVIATDIKSGPLSSARKNAEKYGAEIELRKGGGLEPIAVGEVECIIIAGMGGEMIEKILTEGADRAECAKLLLQPMSAQDTLRKYLAENGYEIICEDIATESEKVYNLLVVGRGKTTFPDEFSQHLPSYLYDHPLFPALLEKKKREFTKILDGISKSNEKDPEYCKKLRGFLERINDLEKGDI